MKTYTCEKCGDVFTSKARLVKYCSQECASAAGCQRYHARHRETINERRRAWYAAHRDTERERLRGRIRKDLKVKGGGVSQSSGRSTAVRSRTAVAIHGQLPQRIES